MTRKDYRLIATVMRRAWDRTETGTPESEAVALMVADFTASLDAMYENFDRRKFIEACVGINVTV